MQVLKTVRQAGEFGIQTGPVRFDWKAVMARKRRLVESLQTEKRAALEERGITYLPGVARFVAKDEIAVNGEHVRAKGTLVATGSRTLRPPVQGIDLAMTSDDALSLDELPEEMLIIGGGFIAMEFSHIFHTFGVHVTVVEMADGVLVGHDREISGELARLMRQKGIDLHLSTRVTAVEGRPGDLRVTAEGPQGPRTFECQLVMNAAGRGPNVEGLGLEVAGVKVSKKGIEVDEYLETSVSGMFAAGDVVGRYMLTPIASYEAKIAAQNAVSAVKEKPDYRVVPSAVFSDPEVGSVGLTEEQARAAGVPYRVMRYDFADLGAAQLRGETEGFAKLLFHEESDEILGAHILGPEASELVQEIAFAMQGRLTEATVGSTVLIHPTLSEAIGAVTTTARTGHQEGCCG